MKHETEEGFKYLNSLFKIVAFICVFLSCPGIFSLWHICIGVLLSVKACLNASFWSIFQESKTFELQIPAHILVSDYHSSSLCTTLIDFQKLKNLVFASRSTDLLSISNYHSLFLLYQIIIHFIIICFAVRWIKPHDSSFMFSIILVADADFYCISERHSLGGNKLALSISENWPLFPLLMNISFTSSLNQKFSPSSSFSQSYFHCFCTSWKLLCGALCDFQRVCARTILLSSQLGRIRDYLGCHVSHCDLIFYWFSSVIVRSLLGIVYSWL